MSFSVIPRYIWHVPRNATGGYFFSGPETSLSAPFSATGAFRLDFSRLSGDTLNYVETALQEKGYSIVIEWIQAGDDQDIRIIGHAIRAVPAESMDTDFPTSIFVGTPYGVGPYGSGTYGGVGTGGFGSFILDMSRLSGSDTSVYQFHSPIQERGRSVQIEWIQSAAQDIRVIGHAVRVVPAEGHSLEPS